MAQLNVRPEVARIAENLGYDFSKLQRISDMFRRDASAFERREQERIQAMPMREALEEQRRIAQREQAAGRSTTPVNSRGGFKQPDEDRLRSSIQQLQASIQNAEATAKALLERGDVQSAQQIQYQVSEDRKILASLAGGLGQTPAERERLGEITGVRSVDGVVKRGNLQSEGLGDAADAVIGADQTTLQNAGGFRGRNEEVSLADAQLMRDEQDRARSRQSPEAFAQLGTEQRPDLRTPEGMAAYVYRLQAEGKSGSQISQQIDRDLNNIQFDPIAGRSEFSELALEQNTVPKRDARGNLGQWKMGDDGERFWERPGGLPQARSEAEARARGEGLEGLTDAQIYADDRAMGTPGPRGGLQATPNEASPTNRSPNQSKNAFIRRTHDRRVPADEGYFAKQAQKARQDRGRSDRYIEPLAALQEKIDSGELTLDSVHTIPEAKNSKGQVIRGEQQIRVGDLMQRLRANQPAKFENGVPSPNQGPLMEIRSEEARTRDLIERDRRFRDGDLNDQDIQDLQQSRARRRGESFAVQDPRAQAGQQPLVGNLRRDGIHQANPGQRILEIQQNAARLGGRDLPAEAAGVDFNDPSQLSRYLDEGGGLYPEKGAGDQAINSASAIREAEKIDQMYADAQRLAAQSPGPSAEAAMRRAKNAEAKYLDTIDERLGAGASAELGDKRTQLPGTVNPGMRAELIGGSERPFDSTSQRDALKESFQIPGGQFFDPAEMNLTRDQFASLTAFEQEQLLQARGNQVQARKMGVPEIAQLGTRYEGESADLGNVPLRPSQAAMATRMPGPSPVGGDGGFFADGRSGADLALVTDNAPMQGPIGDRSGIDWVAKNVTGKYDKTETVSMDFDSLQAGTPPGFGRDISIGENLNEITRQFQARNIPLPAGGIRTIQDLENASALYADQKLGEGLKNGVYEPSLDDGSDPRKAYRRKNVTEVLYDFGYRDGSTATKGLAQSLFQVTAAQDGISKELFNEGLGGQRLTMNPKGQATAPGGAIIGMNNRGEFEDSVQIASVGSAPNARAPKADRAARVEAFKANALEQGMDTAQVKFIEDEIMKGSQPATIKQAFRQLDPVGRIQAEADLAVRQNPEMATEIKALAQMQIADVLADPQSLAQARSPLVGKVDGQQAGKADRGLVFAKADSAMAVERVSRIKEKAAADIAANPGAEEAIATKAQKDIDNAVFRHRENVAKKAMGYEAKNEAKAIKDGRSFAPKQIRLDGETNPNRFTVRRKLQKDRELEAWRNGLDRSDVPTSLPRAGVEPRPGLGPLGRDFVRQDENTGLRQGNALEMQNIRMGGGVEGIPRQFAPGATPNQFISPNADVRAVGNRGDLARAANADWRAPLLTGSGGANRRNVSMAPVGTVTGNPSINPRFKGDRSQGVAGSQSSIQTPYAVIANESATRASNNAQLRVDAPSEPALKREIQAEAAARDPWKSTAAPSEPLFGLGSQPGPAQTPDPWVRQSPAPSGANPDGPASRPSIGRTRRAYQAQSARNRRMGIGAAISGGAALGAAGINGIISGEREKREEEKQLAY